MTTSQVATVGHEFLGLPITATRASAAISPMCLFISPISVIKRIPRVCRQKHRFANILFRNTFRT
jgi:hypothetical protein